MWLWRPSAILLSAGWRSSGRVRYWTYGVKHVKQTLCYSINPQAQLLAMQLQLKPGSLRTGGGGGDLWRKGDVVSPSPKAGSWHLSPQMSKKRILYWLLHFCLVGFVLFGSSVSSMMSFYPGRQQTLPSSSFKGHQGTVTWTHTRIPHDPISRHMKSTLPSAAQIWCPGIGSQRRASLRISQSYNGGAYQTQKSCLKAESAVCSAPGSHLSRNKVNIGLCWTSDESSLCPGPALERMSSRKGFYIYFACMTHLLQFCWQEEMKNT